MTHFAVHIGGDELDQVRQLLNGRGIPTIGPAEPGLGQGPYIPGAELEAFVDADSSQEAENRVRSIIPDGDYTVQVQAPPA